MVRVRESASRLARGRQRVLITGESGVGKHLVARFLHQRSNRSSGPFITVAATGASEAQLTKQLFGDGEWAGLKARGTHATGTFAACDGGTLFLDEVSDLPLSVQSQLVRALDDGVAVEGKRRATVRIIGSTSKELGHLVAAGRFREDLMFRLRAAHVHIPPLRDRRDDVRPLAEWRLSSLPRHIEYRADAWKAMEHYYWPGNVRELVNVVEQGADLVDGGVISLDDLPESIRGYGGDGIRPKDERRRHVADDLFTKLVDGEVDFWCDVHDVFIARDLTRDDLRGVVRRGLATTHGSYRALLALFGMQDRDYKRLLNFLAAHDCAVDFRPYRGASRRPREVGLHAVS
jgi:sigma-54 dependent transcriptional regulator, acetoin dehydrogenase operon transcriptional activator AcoR